MIGFLFASGARTWRRRGHPTNRTGARARASTKQRPGRFKSMGCSPREAVVKKVARSSQGAPLVERIAEAHEMARGSIVGTLCC
jgi:hypothetical protein